ncbi:MAG: hypothetical protein Q9187_000030 [Circinaria calcarea]
MDPFSLAVGITGLIGLIAKTLTLTKEYFDGARNASKAAAALAKELDILYSNLSRLDEFLRSENAKGQSFRETSVLVSSTSACQATIRTLYNKLTAVGESRITRALWPLNEKEHQQSMQELRAFSQWIQFALTVDGCALLAKTSEDVMEILGKQLESFQILKELDLHSSSMKRSIEEQNRELRNHREVQERENILNWISTFEYEQKHHAIRMPRVEGTGEWLLDRNEFRQWRDDKDSPKVLWCHGIQGSGKSVLTSLVIDRLRDDFTNPNTAIAFLYFDYRNQDHQSPDNMLASLLKQVVATGSAIPKAVSEIHEKLGDQQKRPQLQDLEKMLSITCQDFDRVFFVVDALDECDEGRYRRTFMQVLTSLQTAPNISLFVTSRPYLQDIKRTFDSAPQIRIEASESDLRRYLSREIEIGGLTDIIDESFKIEIIERITSGAQKMFLLPALQIQTIMSEPTAGEMEEALDIMPRTLHDAFKETLARIQRQPGGRNRLGMNTLMWLSHAKSPLMVNELSDALAIRSGQPALNPKNRPSQKMMVECCLGLVTTDEESGRIRLVHYAVQEYFRDQQKEIFPSGESEIAEMCLTYLFFDSFAEGCCDREEDILDRLEEYPFLGYAATHWGKHVQSSQDESVAQLALNLLRSKLRRSFHIQVHQFLRGLRKKYWEPDEVKSVTELHVVALFGLHDAARKIVDSKEVDIDAKTYIGTTALMRAASYGHSELVRMLLAEGADPTKANWYGTSLHCAAEAGQCKAIKELLKTGMDIDMKDDFGRTALHCAAQEGHISAVHVLLEYGADPFARDEEGMAPIHYAAEGGYEEIVSWLLDYGADPFARDEEGMTPIHYAAEGGYEEIMSWLLESEADVTRERGRG